MTKQKPKMWFVPIRVYARREKIIIEGKTIEDAINALKTSESYYKNFNKLSPEKQKDFISKITGFPEVFELEDEFYENSGISANNKMPLEEIPKCKYRQWNKKWNEYFCRGLDPKEVSYPNMFCIIHGEHFRFDLPQDCPYLKQESKYIQFTE